MVPILATFNHFLLLVLIMGLFTSQFDSSASSSIGGLVKHEHEIGQSAVSLEH